MLYSHDTYGLGHLRRTLKLATAFGSRRRLSQLIATGSPLAHRFDLPPDADYIKLPSVVKVAHESYESRSLGLPFHAIRDLRRDVLLSAARHFRPDIVVVDNVPGGLKRELLPTLRHLKATSCKLVLGLRDVVDGAERVRRTWAVDGSRELMDDVYDRILVYGLRGIFDPVAEYGFSDDAARKTRFVGYLAQDPVEPGPERIRSELGVADDVPLVLVMAGGGQDGYDLLRAFLDAIRGPQPFESVLVGGPLMPEERRQRIASLAAARSAHHIDFVDDVASYVQAADAVVSMGGYNSVCELLSLGRPALVIPRVAPRREQLIRARLLSRRGLLHMLHPAEASPQRVHAEVVRLLEEGRAPRTLRMNGLARAAEAIDELLDTVRVEAALEGAGARFG